LQQVEISLALTPKAEAPTTAVFFVIHQPEELIVKLKGQ